MTFRTIYFSFTTQFRFLLSVVQRTLMSISDNYLSYVEKLGASQLEPLEGAYVGGILPFHEYFLRLPFMNLP